MCWNAPILWQVFHRKTNDHNSRNGRETSQMALQKLLEQNFWSSKGQERSQNLSEITSMVRSFVRQVFEVAIQWGINSKVETEFFAYPQPWNSLNQSTATVPDACGHGAGKPRSLVSMVSKLHAALNWFLQQKKLARYRCQLYLWSCPILTELICLVWRLAIERSGIQPSTAFR
jgi:hypothetical protein